MLAPLFRERLFQLKQEQLAHVQMMGETLHTNGE
jgi:hypothetical protein